MAYRCGDCSYKGSRFPGSQCPACGSFNVSEHNSAQKMKPTEARKPYRLGLLVALWIYLIYAVLSKLFFS